MNETSSTSEKPIGFECKHATYVRANNGSAHDCLAIKEYACYADGRREPRIRYIRDYKRPFWITKPNFRNHKDKKAWESIDRVKAFESTQVSLIKNICRAMGRAPSKAVSLRMLCRDPYIYGCDITTPVLAKRKYMEQWPDLISPNHVACLDIESDMVEGHGRAIMGSVTFKDKARLVVLKSFFKGIHNPEAKLREAFTKYLGHYEIERKITLEIEFVDTPGQTAERLIKTNHEWKPDILAIWNMNFDIPRLVKELETEGYDIADVFSDPTCHPVFKYFDYKEGASQKVTQSGKVMPLHPADRWHVATFPASFYILDAMCVYKKIRTAKGSETGGYGLDAVLERNLGIRKLKFEEANHVHGAAWHTFMQQNYPIEYCIYNLFDCISMELLDEKTGDLKNKISTFCEHSEYSRFPSQPRRTCDDLHFFCLENKLVIASTSDKMVDDLDEYNQSLRGWICTLPSHLVFDDGVHAIKELPEQSTTIRCHNADLDITSTYPSEQALLNVSKETTIFELSKIEGMDTRTQRSIGINLSGGFVNAVDICCNAYKAPTFDTLLNAFNKSLGKTKEVDATNTFDHRPSGGLGLPGQTEETLLGWSDGYDEDASDDADDEVDLVL